MGDTVKATYTESVAFQVVPLAEGRDARGIGARSPNAFPAVGWSDEQVTTSFKVASVDPKTNVLWVTLPNGNTKKIDVQRADAQARLKTLSPGDVVSVT